MGLNPHVVQDTTADLEHALGKCTLEGQKFCARTVGSLDRETGKLIDQYSVLEDHTKEIAELVSKRFLTDLDKAMKKRGFCSAEQEARMLASVMSDKEWKEWKE